MVKLIMGAAGTGKTKTIIDNGWDRSFAGFSPDSRRSGGDSGRICREKYRRKRRIE